MRKLLHTLWPELATPATASTIRSDRQGRGPKPPPVIHLPDTARANGVRIIGASGSGKTVLATWILFSDFLRRQAHVVLDPTGSLIDGLIDKIRRYAQAQGLTSWQQEQLFSRIIYVDLSGQVAGQVMPFSLLRRYPGEPLSVVADRVLNWILHTYPESLNAPIEGFSAVAKVLQPALILLAALNGELQITELPDLIINYKNPYWKTVCQKALQNYPLEAAEAVRFFTKEFPSWSNQDRARRTNLLEKIMAPWRYSPGVRATFGAAGVGLDYDQIINEGQLVLLDARNLDGEFKTQLLSWIVFGDLLGYIKQRGSGRHKPLGLTVDEISTLAFASPAAQELFAQDLGFLVNVFKRQYRLWLTIIHQSATSQLHPAIQQHLNAIGNQIVGKLDYESALRTAPELFGHQRVIKRWDPKYMYIPPEGVQIIDATPVEYYANDVLQMQTQVLQDLDTFKFLCRLTTTEGGGRSPLQELDMTPVLGAFPDYAQVATWRRTHTAGVAVDATLARIAARLHTPNGTGFAIVQDNAYDHAGFLKPEYREGHAHG